MSVGGLRGGGRGSEGRDLLEQGREEREPRSWGGARANALQHRGALAMFTFQPLLLLRPTVKALRQLTKLMAG